MECQIIDSLCMASAFRKLVPNAFYQYFGGFCPIPIMPDYFRNKQLVCFALEYTENYGYSSLNIIHDILPALKLDIRHYPISIMVEWLIKVD